MTLTDVLIDMIGAANNAAQPTDMAVGTVTSTSPLEIQLDVSQAPLRKEVLLLTESVVEKKIKGIEDLSHTHSVSLTSGSALSGQYAHTHSVSGSTGAALGRAVCYVNGAALPSDASGVTITRGLAQGDKVLLLSVQHGQKYIVLSRLF